MPPMAFFGAKDVWGWPWYAAIAFLGGWLLMFAIYAGIALFTGISSVFRRA